VRAADPLVSVVIASVNGLPAIGECLEALTRQEGTVSLEVLVADRCGEEVRSALRRRFPTVHVIAAEAAASVPALRALGIARAKGQMIAILEDHCNVERGWLEAIARQREAGHLVVGGAVENGSVERTIDWAVFFCEYARFMPPVPRGVVAEITGNNTVYDRSVLERLGPDVQEDVWESFLHDRMRALGVPFHSDPDLVVTHKKRFGYLYFLAQRYHYSRSFAGMRMKGRPWWKRVGYACATPLLPGLLMGRMAATVARKRRHGARFLQASPAIATFLVSWACGEAVGALLGPGQSLQRVE
jgi:glycosyltransferase involved in cell wall biosynthesis